MIALLGKANEVFVTVFVFAMLSECLSLTLSDFFASLFCASCTLDSNYVLSSSSSSSRPEYVPLLSNGLFKVLRMGALGS